MRSCELEWSKPHVLVIESVVTAIEQLVNSSNISLHPWNFVDSRWIHHDLLFGIDRNNISKLIK